MDTDIADINEDLKLDARILRICRGDLLVFDRRARQKVLVHTEDACRYRVGENVCIAYNGIMTMSLPPQISASRISRGPCRCC